MLMKNAPNNLTRTVMEAAPYLGFIVQDAIDQKTKEDLLTKQAIEVVLENGNTDVIRPESIFLKGVDNLSTDDIKSFINYYVNFAVEKSEADEVEYKEVSQIPFKVQWINDTLANIVFDSHDMVRIAFSKLSPEEIVTEPEFVSNGAYVQELVKMRPTYPYAPVEPFKKTQSLFARIDKPKVDDNVMDDESLEPLLQMRQLLQSDQKVAGASKYSRYYLFNGDPERHNTWYRPRRRHDTDNEEQEERHVDRNDDEDLFADRIQGSRRSRGDRSNRRGREPANQDDDTDLFADRLREKSPSRANERSRERKRPGRRARNRKNNRQKVNTADLSHQAEGNTIDLNDVTMKTDGTSEPVSGP